jgi:hypothetical protein
MICVLTQGLTLVRVVLHVQFCLFDYRAAAAGLHKNADALCRTRSLDHANYIELETRSRNL